MRPDGRCGGALMARRLRFIFVQPPCASYPDVTDREGWRLHPGARVRVERPNTVVPGRMDSFTGEVVAIGEGTRHGVPTVLVSVRVPGQAHTHTVAPYHCRVLRRSARR